MHRRAALAGLLAFAGCAAPRLPDPAPGERIAQTEEFEVLRLGRRCYALLVRSGATRRVGSNSGFIVTSRGVVVIDTHLSADVEKRALEQIRAVTPLPVTHVINTHWHDDHAGGNDAHGVSVTTIAHAGSAGKLKRPPAVALKADHALFEGPDRVEIHALGHAHSVGDLAVYDPQDRVLYMGDAYVRGFVGYLAEGALKEWRAALGRMMALDVRLAVPDHGAAGGPEPMAEFRTYLGDFAVSARDHFRKRGAPEGYELPEKYQRYGARYFLEDNVRHAFELWKQGRLEK